MRLFRPQLKSIFYLCAGALVALPILIALPQHAVPRTVASPLVFNLDSAQSTVHWTLGGSLHTVHGTFALKTGRLRLDPATGKASGEFIADSTSGKSGNDGRDRKMHKEVLESARFTEIIFRPDKVTGSLPAQGECTLQLHGIFVLRGSEHELTVPVQANIAGDHWSGTSKFAIPYVDWGLKDPSTWLIKADHSVTINMELKGTVQASAAK